MIDRLLSVIAPHYCYGCGAAGTVLCDCCKNNIFDETFRECVLCANPVMGTNLCSSHSLPYSALWCAAHREGPLAKVIDDYKFQRAKSAYGVLAEVLDERLPDFPENTVIVPIPTAPRNVRIRGYDHMLLVGRELAKRRGLRLGLPLRRVSNLTQHFTKSAAKRRAQAEGFFEVREKIDPKAEYLLVDDIFTTGSTVESAANCLRAGGATEVKAAIIARH